MTVPDGVKQGLLALGLEDDIPLPQVFDFEEVTESLGDGDTVDEVVRALVELLADGKIVVSHGHWSEEPVYVTREKARDLLLDKRRYSYSSEEAFGLDRVYYVNIENIQPGFRPY